MAGDSETETQPMQARITAFWNVVAPGYNTPDNVATRGSAAYDAWRETIRSLLPSAPSDLLDVGTGTGFVARITAELGHRVTGIDLADQMLHSARSGIERAGMAVSFVTGDAVRPPFPPESFDIVISRSLIWTLREPAAAFRSWHRLLRPGGRVVAIYGLGPAEADEPEQTETAVEGSTGLFERHYTKETRAALPGMRLVDHAPLIRMAEASGFVDATVTSLEAVRGWETSPGSELPYALVGHRASA